MISSVKKNDETVSSTVDKPSNGSQSFDKIGLLEVISGDIVLRGRNGERDHVYPIERAAKRYDETTKMVLAMLRTGMKGWDTLSEIAEDLKHKVLEAVRQRRSLNRSIPQCALDFEQKHS